MKKISDRIAAGLHAIGIERGHRAALMVRPSPELFALTFGMFKAGVVPVDTSPASMKAARPRSCPNAWKR